MLAICLSFNIQILLWIRLCFVILDGKDVLAAAQRLIREQTSWYNLLCTGLWLQVNKIRECPQHPSVVVTHTDAPELFAWSTERQPNRQGDKV